MHPDLRTNRWRQARSSEGGFTLVELLVSMIIITIIFGLSFTILTTTISSTKTGQARSNAIDEARLGVEQLERQIRSGNVISAPTYDSAAKTWLLQVYTQVNGPQRCVQWKLDSVADQLLFRSWSPTWATDGDVTGWRVIARYVVNTPPPAKADEAPFIRSSGDLYGTRLLDVHLLVQADGAPTPTVIDTSITGRNTTFGYNQAVCTSSIPGG